MVFHNEKSILKGTTKCGVLSSATLDSNANLAGSLCAPHGVHRLPSFRQAISPVKRRFGIARNARLSMASLSLSSPCIQGGKWNYSMLSWSYIMSSLATPHRRQRKPLDIRRWTHAYGRLTKYTKSQNGMMAVMMINGHPAYRSMELMKANENLFSWS